MKALIIAALAIVSATVSTAAMAGPCIYPSDRAADGSRCGDRASTIRPGGR